MNEIDVKLDLAGSAAATEVQQDMQAGTADLSWNTDVPPADVQGLETPTWNAQLGTFPAPGTTNPYLVFNVQSPNNNGALGNVKVRQALEYAIDKVAIGKIYGGASLNQPLNQVIGPGAEGYVQFNDYPTNEQPGQPCASASRCSKAAGYPNGLTLKDYYRNSGNHPAVFQEVQSDFAEVRRDGCRHPDRHRLLRLLGHRRDVAQRAQGRQVGHHRARLDPGLVRPRPTAVPPSRTSSTARSASQAATGAATTIPAVDALVNQAKSATTVSAAASLWHQADEQVMKDAAFIPFQTQLTPLFRSTRVHNAIFQPFSEGYDYTQIWLSS